LAAWSINDDFVDAAAEGDLEKAKWLASRNEIEINFVNAAGKTALIAAIENSQEDFVRYLLKDFPCLDVHKSTGDISIVMRAVNEGNLEIFRILEGDPRTKRTYLEPAAEAKSSSGTILRARVNDLPSYVVYPDPEHVGSNRVLRGGNWTIAHPHQGEGVHSCDCIVVKWGR
jgi:hypothetical protein